MHRQGSIGVGATRGRDGVAWGHRGRTGPPRRRGPLASLLLTAGLVACGVDRPLVEVSAEGRWRPAAFEIASMGGQRAGATITFVLRLVGASGERLTVEGTVEIDPQATLVAGRWGEDGGPAPRSGVVSAAALDFFGGQGGRPSLGGQLSLSAGGAEVYRVNLPATVLSAER